MEPDQNEPVNPLSRIRRAFVALGFVMAIGTKVTAARAGVVADVRMKFRDGQHGEDDPPEYSKHDNRAQACGEKTAFPAATGFAPGAGGYHPGSWRPA